MKRFCAALAAVLVAGLAPAGAQAAPAPEALKITKADIDKGMKEAPAVLTEAGVAGTITNARFIGALTLPADPKVKDAKPTTVNGYEVACKEGGGYSMLTMKPKAMVQDCIASASSPVLTCHLPENADPKASLNPVIAEAGRTCKVADAKYLGQTGAGISFYEASCKPGEGYILQREPGKPAIANPCLGMVETKLACSLTTVDAAKTYAKSLAVGVKKPCAITDIRFVGTTASGFDG